ncbi:MAG: magnesium transporter, partial [Paramuribaculum sp.]|nr:magnesium transporter [Paramuribaculum sp.]
MKEFTPEYLDRIRSIIQNGDTDQARHELETLHPADIAELYQELNLSEAEFLYRLLDSEVDADVLMELDEDDRRKLLEGMSADEIAKQLIDHLDT